MKIVGIETFTVDAGWRPWIFVKVETDEGVTGYGECSDGRSPLAVVGAVEDMKPVLIGTDPRAYEMRFWDMLRSARQSPGGILAKAIAGVELALIDIKAKALGISAVELFGGPTRESVRVYWSHCGSTRARMSDILGTPPIRTMADISELGREVVRRGYTALKTNIVIPGDSPSVWIAGFGVGPGTTDQIVTRQLLRHIEELIGTFRDAVGPDVDINLDLNFNFKTEGAMRIAKVLEQFDLLWLEIDMYDPKAILADQGVDDDKDMHRGESLLHEGLYSLLRPARRRRFYDRPPLERIQPGKENSRSRRGLPIEHRAAQLLQSPGNIHQREPVRGGAERADNGDRSRRRSVEGRPHDKRTRDHKRRDDRSQRPRMGHRTCRGSRARASVA